MSNMTLNQLAIAFGKYIAGYRPESEMWSAEDQAAFDFAMSSGATHDLYTDNDAERLMPSLKTRSTEMTTNKDTERAELKPRAELLALAEKCGAHLTGKPDGSEAITVVFSVLAWRAFDAALLAANKACRHCGGKGYTMAGDFMVGCICQIPPEQIEQQISVWAADKAGGERAELSDAQIAEFLPSVKHAPNGVRYEVYCFEDVCAAVRKAAVRKAAALLAADKAGGEVVAWTVLEENADERRMFNESVKFIGGGSPILAIAETLRTMAAVQPNGSFRDQLRIMANEVAKFYTHPQPQAEASVPRNVTKEEDRVLRRALLRSFVLVDQKPQAEYFCYAHPKTIGADTVGGEPLLVRDLAEIIGKDVPTVCSAIAELGFGKHSVNMALHPDAAIAVAKHFADKAGGEVVGYTDEWGSAYRFKWAGKLPPNITLYTHPQARAEAGGEPVLFVNPKIIDESTGKVRKGIEALTWSSRPIEGAWTMPLYAGPQPQAEALPAERVPQYHCIGFIDGYGTEIKDKSAKMKAPRAVYVVANGDGKV